MAIKEITGSALKGSDRVVLRDEDGVLRYFKLRRLTSIIDGKGINFRQGDRETDLEAWFIGGRVPGQLSDTGKWYKDRGDYVYVEREPELTAKQKLDKLTAGLRADAENPTSKRLLAEIGES